MRHCLQSILSPGLAVGLVLAWSIPSPSFAKPGGGKGGGGGRGSVSRGGKSSRASGVTRGSRSQKFKSVPQQVGPSSNQRSRGAGQSSAKAKHQQSQPAGRGGGPAGWDSNTSRRGSHRSQHAGHRRDNYHRHGTHNHTFFYFSPYGYGFGYYGRGFGFSLGWPAFSYYDYYRVGPYPARYGRPYFEDYWTVESVPVGPASDPVVPCSSSAAEFQWKAEQAFREQRYDDAARLSNHALIEDRQNGHLHLFASQILLALDDYRASAAAIQQGASLLDRQHWGFVVERSASFYRGGEYVRQLDRLSDFIAESPTETYALFLRGYHHLFLGNVDAARSDLSRVVELESRDRLAADLLATLGDDLPPPNRHTLPGPTPEAESIAPVPESPSSGQHSRHD